MKKMIKTLKFHMESGSREIIWDLVDTDYDQFYIEPDMIKDGSRFVVMNNQETIVVGIYNVIVAFNLFKEYGIEVDKMMTEKVREVLGFKRVF